MIRSTIIIFTNIDKLSAISDSFSDRRDVKLLNENDVLLFNDQSNEFAACDSFSESGIYFVKDDIEEQKFNDLIGTDLGNYYVLAHGKPGFIFDRFKPRFKEGEHESDGKYYPKVVEILSNNENDKVEKIIDKVFKFDYDLEAKLEFLHNCWNEGKLVKKPDDLEAYLTNYEATEFASVDEFYVALSNLRDELLGV